MSRGDGFLRDSLHGTGAGEGAHSDGRYCGRMVVWTCTCDAQKVVIRHVVSISRAPTSMSSR